MSSLASTNQARPKLTIIRVEVWSSTADELIRYKEFPVTDKDGADRFSLSALRQGYFVRTKELP